MYTYKFPENKVPDGGEEAYGITMKKEVLGYEFDVMLLGIHEDNPYFDAPVEKSESHVFVSSAMARKYQLSAGDVLFLDDKEDACQYTFTVDGIVNYSVGFVVFMDIESLRSLMDADEDYYNIVFADHALDIDSDRLYATLSKDGIVKSSTVFTSHMMPLYMMMTVVAALMFAIVMYLMMMVMIDRQALSVSLFKIFGYRKREIGRLYLDGNFFVVAVGAFVGMPLSKAVIDAIYPYLVSNVACGMNLVFSWQTYAAIFVGILVLYLTINRFMMFRINRILPAEALKNRE